jgi:hypothetical protein
MIIDKYYFLVHTSAMTPPGMAFSGIAIEYSVWSRVGTTSLTSITVISTVAVALSGIVSATVIGHH